jgi:hypothetical protein
MHFVVLVLLATLTNFIAHRSPRRFHFPTHLNSQSA